MREKHTVSRHQRSYCLCPLTAALFTCLICSLSGQPSKASSLGAVLRTPDILAQGNAAQNRKAETENLFQKGIQQFRHSQFREALETYQQVLKLRQEIKDQAGEGETLYQIGVVYRHLSQYPQALKSMGEALEIAHLINDRHLLGRTLSESGFIYYRLSQYPKALELYQQALAIARETSDRMVEAHTLDYLGVVYHRQGKYDRALEFHQQALTISRAISDRAGEGLILSNIGVVYDSLGNYPKAQMFASQALVISREIGDRFKESLILNNMGVTYGNLGQYDRALDFYQQALSLHREIGNKAGEGFALNNIGKVYNSLGQYSQALDFYQQVLTIQREISDRMGEGIALSNIGAVYWNLGQYSQALKFYEQALAIAKEIGNHPGEGNILSSMGGVYSGWGQYARALEFYQKALGIWKEIGNQAGEGQTFNSIGSIYYSLGQYTEALAIYQQALAIRREIGDRAGEGTTLNNIGLAYNFLGRYAEALEVYQQALAIRRQIGDRAGEGNTLNNLALLYDLQGQDNQALVVFGQALAIRRQIGDRAGEGTTLNNIGLIHQQLSEDSKALESYQQALGIFQEIGNRPGERSALSNIGSLLDQQNQTELAIIFYKQSVNVTEAIRQDIQGLPKEQQQSYTETIADNYRALADLLLKQDRVLEAQRVLDLLKVQELEDYLRNVRGSDNSAQGLAERSAEGQIKKGYEVILEKAIQLGKQLSQLERIPPAKRTEVQRQYVIELRKNEQEITQQFQNFLKSPEVATLIAQLRQTTGGQNFDLENNATNLQNNLKKLQQKAVILYPFVLDDRLELVIVSPYAPPIRRTVAVKREELNRAIVEFRAALRNPFTDAKTSAQKLYKWLIKPIENDLEQGETKTIIYAPDGQLRYIPLAALYDGKQWLVQKFSINNITSVSLTDFNTTPQQKLQVFAGAFVHGSHNVQVGERQVAFRGLKYAGVEVENIANTVPGTTKVLDLQFNPDTVLQMNDYSVVHLATHGAFVTGKPEDSFILFGDGKPATFRDIEKWRFPNVDLVVLSACETGLGDKLGDGREILGFGYQMQRTGARAAIASLWSVDDGGTQALMNAFYATLETGKITKAQALQKAQIALITGDEKAMSGERGLVAMGTVDNQSPAVAINRLSHPFYWASFILIGNGL